MKRIFLLIVTNIADTTLGSLTDFEQGRPLANRIGVELRGP